ncbi:DUF2076 domain-containing protein [Buchnera aphidicola (Formosaphis micheliae)]|uniref:DUF2076 domain-containing protein n=1 Tax=Buchnera aphidicola TaxID=9 RepID=UPI0031B87A57
MELEDKKIIENLFNRLDHVEKNSVSRDTVAEQLIKDLLIKQSNAPYYMVQIILVQETAIKKLNDDIAKLENKIVVMKEENKKNNSSGFLSGLFGSSNKENNQKNIKNSWNETNNTGNMQQRPQVLDHNKPTSGYVATNHGNSNVFSGSGNHHPIGSFLGSALQTATGVAGGIVMGNMLMNLFQHKHSEEELFNNMHNASDSHLYSTSSIQNAEEINKFDNIKQEESSNFYNETDHYSDNSIVHDEFNNDDLDTDIDINDDDSSYI